LLLPCRSLIICHELESKRHELSKCHVDTSTFSMKDRDIVTL